MVYTMSKLISAAFLHDKMYDLFWKILRHKRKYARRKIDTSLSEILFKMYLCQGLMYTSQIVDICEKFYNNVIWDLLMYSHHVH